MFSASRDMLTFRRLLRRLKQRTPYLVVKNLRPVFSWAISFTQGAKRIRSRLIHQGVLLLQRTAALDSPGGTHPQYDF